MLVNIEYPFNRMLLHFVKTFSLPPTRFPLILKNDSFVARIISGRENEAIHKFIVPHSSKTSKNIISFARMILTEQFSKRNICKNYGSTQFSPHPLLLPQLFL